MTSADLARIKQLAEAPYAEGAIDALLEAVPALVAEVERLRAENERLEQNAVRMREYRFAMENIPTDGKGNPLPGDTRASEFVAIHLRDACDHSVHPASDCPICSSTKDPHA